MERTAYVMVDGLLATHCYGDQTIAELAELVAHEHANQLDWKVGDERTFDIVVEDDEENCQYKVKATIVCDLCVTLSDLRGGDNE